MYHPRPHLASPELTPLIPLNHCHPAPKSAFHKNNKNKLRFFSKFLREVSSRFSFPPKSPSPRPKTIQITDPIQNKRRETFIKPRESACSTGMKSLKSQSSIKSLKSRCKKTLRVSSSVESFGCVDAKAIERYENEWRQSEQKTLQLEIQTPRTPKRPERPESIWHDSNTSTLLSTGVERPPTPGPSRRPRSSWYDSTTPDGSVLEVPSTLKRPNTSWYDSAASSPSSDDGGVSYLPANKQAISWYDPSPSPGLVQELPVEEQTYLQIPGIAVPLRSEHPQRLESQRANASSPVVNYKLIARPARCYSPPSLPLTSPVPSVGPADIDQQSQESSLLELLDWPWSSEPAFRDPYTSTANGLGQSSPGLLSVLPGNTEYTVAPLTISKTSAATESSEMRFSISDYSHDWFVARRAPHPSKQTEIPPDGYGKKVMRATWLEDVARNSDKDVGSSRVAAEFGTADVARELGEKYREESAYI